MKRGKISDLDRLIEQITAGAGIEAERVLAFRHAIEDGVTLPCDGLVIGEPVTVVDFVCDGNERRGVSAHCRRPDGREYVVGVADVVFPAGTDAAQLVDAYRKWIGAEPRGLAAPAQLVVLSATATGARCRVLGGDERVALHERRVWVPGEIVTMNSTGVESSRIEARALGLTPLRLIPFGEWSPIEEYWGEPGDPVGRWAKPMIERGPRPAFEMEQVIPGYAFDDPDADPIGIAADLTDAGESRKAYKLLMELCEADLRCLDAHAHLGNLAFARSAAGALKHYEVGWQIGGLSLGEDFDGVLAWGHIDNRPFLRCMHGYGLCLWRLRRFAEAARVFERMLWMNPTDNQGIRILMNDVRKKRAWRDD